MAASLPSQGWDETAATCTNYCHGATSQGGANIHPRWTKVDGSQATCGSCHGLPPANHPALATGTPVATCALCHPSTVKADGTIDAPGGKHVNGRVEMEGFTGHGAGLARPRWPGLPRPGGGRPRGRAAASAATPRRSRPRTASGPAPAATTRSPGGPTGPPPASVATDRPTSSAPPRDVHGNTATTAIGVGAHRSHVEAPSGIAQRYDCSVCHEKPGVVFSPGHLDGATTVTGYTGTDPGLQFVEGPGLEPDDRHLRHLLVPRRLQRDVHLLPRRRVGDARAGRLPLRRQAAERRRGTRWTGRRRPAGPATASPVRWVLAQRLARRRATTTRCDICHPGTTPGRHGVHRLLAPRERRGGRRCRAGRRDCFNCH